MRRASIAIALLSLGLVCVASAYARPQAIAPHTTEKNDGVPRYNVIVWPSGPEGATPARYSVSIKARSHSSHRAADGSYVIPNIPPGHYKLVSLAWSDVQYLGEGDTTFDVINADVTLHLKLRGLGEIQGVAKTDDTLAAIPAGVILEIASHEEGSQGRHIDADGRFAVDRVLPGEYEFSVLENPDGVVVRSVRCVGEAVTANAPLPLGDRQKVSDCEVVLGYEFSASAAAQPIETANSLVAQFNSVKNPWSQFDVAKKIVQLHDARALPELEPWLTSEDMQARGNAAFIFAKFGDDRGFQIIREILEDRSTNTKRKVDAFDDAGQRSTELQIVYDRRRAIDLFGDLEDPRAAPLLIPLLNDNELNSDIPWALGKVGNKSAIPPLLALLADKQADRRAEAIQALAELDAREALPQLRGMVDDDAKIYHDWIGTVGNAARVAIAKLEAPPQ